MSIQQCQRMVREMADTKSRVIGDDNEVDLSTLPKHLQRALLKLREIRSEEHVLAGQLELAGYDSNLSSKQTVRLTYNERDRRVKPRQSKVRHLQSAAVLALMKCDTPKARAVVVEKFMKDIEGV